MAAPTGHDMSNPQLFLLPVRFLRGRFSALLVAFLLLFLLEIFFADHPLMRYSIPVFFIVTLLASISAFSDRKRVSSIAIVLGVSAVALRWATYVNDSYVLLLFSGSIGALFFAFITVLILATVLRDQTVTGDTISGALCVYFLIAMVWALLFALMDRTHPGSFQITTGEKMDMDPRYPHSLPIAVFLYFSLITLSTVGYGDIVPLTSSARGLAALEGIVGQFYLAVLVARLVGLYTARGQR
jgi:hypothetical protein